MATTTPWASAGTAVLDQLKVSLDAGLTSTEATRRLEQYGLNKLPEPKKTPWYVRLWHHINNVLIWVLLVSAVAKFIMGDIVDAIVILGVVSVTIGIGMIQEGRAEKSLNAIKNMLSATALVLRDGAWAEVDSEKLVPGDIVRVKAGDRAPADARLIEATNLQVEEAALTGESVAADKITAELGEKIGLGDRTNMLFSSTIVVAGTGTAVITSTGAETEIGRIQDLMATATAEETPLSRTMNMFGKRIALLIVVVALFMMAFGMIVHGMSFRAMFGTAIGVAVAAIPEGLPAVVTIALALGVKALAARKSISRNLTSTETLGSVSTIASDKTGTLTQNEMTVRVIRTGRRSYDVTGTGYAPEGTFVADGADVEISNDITELAQAMVLTNDAIIEPQTNGLWTVTGAPTEGAVLSMGYKAGFRGDGWNRIAEIPFDSKYKYMATLQESPAGERHVIVKGALDAVLGRCTMQAGVNGAEALDADFWNAEMEVMAKQGLRVLAAASMPVAASVDTLVDPTDGGPEGLTLLGIVGIVDPPRPEAIESIRIAHEASIDVKMITGDHVVTAKAIAEEMGITKAGQRANALTGPELEAMSDEDLEAVVRDTHVFARVSPEHKIRVVRALQSHGQIVAMTGDGVNDAPALTQANVGVAMGIKGTEATKAAADLILLDDNFSTIEKAVFEGRRVFENIRKCTLFALPANVAQVTGILIATFLGWTIISGSTGEVMPLAPLSPVLALWINMVVAVCLDLTFASEQAEPGIMNKRPRNQQEPLVTKRAALRLFCFGFVIAAAMMFMFIRELGGLDAIYGQAYYGALAGARSATLSMLTLGTVAMVFNVRRLNGSSFTWNIFRGNKTLSVSLIVLTVLHLSITSIPGLRDAFGLVPTTLAQWSLIIPLAIGCFLAIEGIKWIFRTVEARIDAKAAVKAEAEYNLAA